MYQTAPSLSRALNGMATDLIDGSGTINPAALNSTGMDYLLSIPSDPYFPVYDLLAIEVLNRKVPSKCRDCVPPSHGQR